MRTYKWKGWTSWTPLDGLDFKTVTTGPGTYVVAVSKPLSRVVGVDTIGTLDVGESARLRNHLRSFYRCACGCRGSNSAGRRYVFLI